MIGLVDLLLATLVIVGMTKQATFLPTTYAGCNGATDWRNGTDGRNFFVAANSSGRFTDDEVYSPGEICHSIVQSWVISIPVV